VDEKRDKIKDLEVKEDEAQDIAGGKKIQAKSPGKKAPGYRMRAASVEKKQT
jgi:hypothetical protein